MTVSKSEKRRQEEIAKGQQIGARVSLMQRFDPTYKPNAKIDPALRRQRDIYRNQVRANLAQAERNYGKD